MTIEVYFDALHQIVIGELEKAEKSVHIAMAWLSFYIYQSMFESLNSKGVKITILCGDNEPNRKQIKIIQILRGLGVEVTLYKMPSGKNHMHHKFAVIDEQTVLNGSFNWSGNARKNIENLMVIRDEPDIVRQFLGEFEKIQVLDQAAIKSLQSLKACPQCGGRVATLLVFSSSPMHMTYETWGDIVEVCSLCPDDFTPVMQGVQDTRIYSLFSGYELVTDEGSDVEKYDVDRSLDTHLTGYSSHGVLIHGIGFTGYRLIYRDDEEFFTNIAWKNKFAAEFVLDRYETDFDVKYC
jgi:hypothetical protein